MEAASLFKQQVTYAVLYCADQEEWKQLNRTPYSDTIRDECINRLHPEEFSHAQRILLATYLHLHGALKNANLLSDKRLKDLRRKFEITDEFASLVLHGTKRLDKDMVLSGKTPIASILNPNNRVAAWAADVVYRAHTEGGYSKKQKVLGLMAQEYEHPLDRMALNALRGTPGLEIATRAFWKYGLEKILRVQYTGSNILVTKKNFPQVHRALEAVCQTLDVSPLPDVYLQNGFIGAKTTGVENPILILTTGTIGLLSYDELCFVIAHEVGHIKSQHILYHDMAEVIPFMASMGGAVGGIISSGLQLALLNWHRKSEFSSDRAGLLACQNIDAATSAFMKIAGAPPKYYRTLKPEDFKQQAKDFEGIDDNLSKIAKNLSVMFATHPWTVMRGHELYKWMESGEYEKVRDRTNTISSLQLSNNNPAGGHSCLGCGATLNEGDKFCTGCGREISSPELPKVIHL